jgi:asparagine synthase (glutamine-hydrolysing)
LARQAFADLLPDLVRLRRSKGGNTTYWLRFFQDRLPALRDLLLEGRIAQRGLLDREIMAQALTPMGLAAGRDFMAINICLTAELWVRAVEAAREAPQGRPAEPGGSGARRPGGTAGLGRGIA